jgi:hypothetical protein
LQKKFDNKPKQLVNYHMAHGAGEQAGRLIGSFMLHHQHDVSSWRNQVPSVLQQLEAKYQEYVDANPGAKCTELEIIQEAILWVAMIIPILARPVPPPPPAFGDEDSPVKPKANKPPPAFGNEDEDEEHNVRARARKWASLVPARDGNVAQTVSSRTLVRVGFMHMAKAAGHYTAVEQAQAEAERPSSLAGGRSSKRKGVRGRLLGAGHLAGGLATVTRKVSTARHRESDEWWEQGGHDEGEDEPAEEASGLSMRLPAARGKGVAADAAGGASISQRLAPPKLPACWQHELPVGI